MKTKVVQHVPMIIFCVFKVFEFSVFQVFKNTSGSQLLSDIFYNYAEKSINNFCTPTTRTDMGSYRIAGQQKKHCNVHQQTRPEHRLFWLLVIYLMSGKAYMSVNVANNG